MLKMNCGQYWEYLTEAAEKIRGQKDYITELDAAIADGDHWLNLTIGFDKVLKQRDAMLDSPDFQKFFQKLAMAMMSAMGGTSGALYGSAYLAASKGLGEVTELEAKHVKDMLNAWAEALMLRGSTKPGDKTMVDAVYPAAVACTEALRQGKSETEMLLAMKRSALEGAEKTKAMEAAKGRASNQPDKGVGHLDPGAVTMGIQLECLADYLMKHCLVLC